LQTKRKMSKIRKELDAKIKMFKAIAALYLSKKVRFDVIPAFAAAMTLFTNRNDAIDELVPLASEDTKDTTAQRDVYRKALYLSATIAAKAIYSYADSIGNLVLKGSMDWTEAKLDALPLDQLGPNCEPIHEKGTELLASVTPFGLDQGKLDTLRSDIDTWVAWESGTRNKQVAITGYKQLLAKNVRENMNLLTGRLDGMVFTLSGSDPALVDLWFNTRDLVPLPKTVTQAKIIVKRKMTDEFIFGAEVQLVNGVVNTAITNMDGEAEFKPIKYGYYLMRVTAPGYKPYVAYQLRILKGKINRFAVELEPEV